MANNEGAETAAVATNVTYCGQCGQENPARRGACLMCFTPLRQEGTGQNCAHCGTENPRELRFCQHCGNPFDPAATRPPTALELALNVLQGGVAALTAGEEPEAYYEEEESGFLGGAPAEALAEMEEPLAPPPSAAPVTATPAYAEPAVPPSALSLQEEALEMAPPPPPAAAPPAELAEEEFAPPPPPPGLVEEAEEEFAPPPPPPGLEEEAAPPPPPPAPSVEPVAAIPGGIVDPLAQASAEAEDEDFGDWTLEIEENDKDKS